jgi:hypothetical protein
LIYGTSQGLAPAETLRDAGSKGGNGTPAIRSRQSCGKTMRFRPAGPDCSNRQQLVWSTRLK